MKRIILTFFVISLFIPLMVCATSGACSSHEGVDCARGWQENGKVYCNDNKWEGSMVFYEYMVMCQDNKISQECIDYISGKDQHLGDINQLLDKALGGRAYMDTSNPYVSQRMDNYVDYLNTLRSNQTERYYNLAKICTDDLKSKERVYLAQQYSKEQDCNEKDGYIYAAGECITKDQSCKNTFGAYSYCTGTDVNGNHYCGCKEGYNWNDDKIICVRIPKYLDGILIKTADYGAVYLIENGKKRAIRSAEIFLAKGYKWEDIVIVSLLEMANYSFGPDVTISENKERGGSITINTRILNIRSLPSINSKIIGRTLKGYKHIVRDEENGWYKINFQLISLNDIKTGWVMGKYTI